jgi:hypothetical protein
LDVSPVDTNYRAGVWLLSAALPTQVAKESVFSKALTRAVAQLLADPSATAQFITLDQLADTMNELISANGKTQVVSYDASGVNGALPFLPNRLYRERRLDRLQISEFHAHWSPISRGVEEGTIASYFTGREAALRRIVRWIERQSGAQGAEPALLVVTGHPGSGKSAVIGRVVTLADEEARQQLSVDHVRADTIPPIGVFDAVIYARAKSYKDVLRELATKVGVQSEKQGDLIEALKHRSEPFIIAVDSLDEAMEPDEVARLFHALAGVSSMRILAGTRHSQLRHLGTAKELIDLDQPEYFDARDVETYVTLRLLSADEPSVETPYRDRPQAAREVAAEVATAAGRNFLIARLVAKTLIDRSEPVDVEHHRFPSSVAAAFDEYLHRFSDREERVRDLLEALAWAEGKGFPARRIWPEVASVLSGKHYGSSDIRWVTDEASDLLVRDIEGDRPVFRLFHVALVEYLRRSYQQYGPDVQNDIVDALCNTLRSPAKAGRRPWFEAHPYVRHYLAVHAAASNRLDEFVVDPWFLAAAEPRNLISALQSCSNESAKVAAKVYREAADQLIVTPSLEERLSYIHLSAKKLHADLFTKHPDCSYSMPWQARWVHWHGTPRLKLTHRFQVATAMALIQRMDKEVVACGMSDGSILLAQLPEGGIQDDLSIDHGVPITALCSARLGGKSAVISGGVDGSLCAWSLEDGSLLFRWTSSNTKDFSIPISSLVSHGDLDSPDAIVAFTSDNFMPGVITAPLLSILNVTSQTATSWNIPRLLNRASYNPATGWRVHPTPLAAVRSQTNELLVGCSSAYGLAILAFDPTAEAWTIKSVGDSSQSEFDTDGNQRHEHSQRGFATGD